MMRPLGLLLLTLMMATPAWGDLTFGVVPRTSSIIQTKSQAKQLTSYLEQSLGEPVRLRIFNSETLLHQWLNRYREVDIAILPESYVRTRPAIEFFRLVGYQPEPDNGIVPCVMVGRRGLPSDRRQQLKDLLLVMDTDQAGLPLLRSMHVAQFGSPGDMVQVSKPVTKPLRRVARTAVRPSAPLHTAKPTATADKPGKTTAARPASAAPSTAAPSTATAEPAAAASNPPRDEGEGSAEPQGVIRPGGTRVAPPAATATEPAMAIAAGHQVAPLETPPMEAPKSRSEQQPGARPDRYSRSARHPATADSGESHQARHYLLLIAAILLSGLLVKLLLLYQRRPRQRPVVPSSRLLIQHDWSELHASPAEETSPADPVASVTPPPSAEPATEPRHHQPATPAEAPAHQSGRPAGLPAGQLQLDGKLGPRQIPALLQLISAARQSGTLLVASRENEKRIIFRNGTICSVSSISRNSHNQTGFLMNKLGYLLIREGKITEDQRDQALVLCEGDANLRMGEALIQMGALRQEDLLESLRYQAKMVLHSLIVFPEGTFEFIPGNTPLRSSDDLRLGVDAFLKEAAAHQNEWRSIREMIPSLDTVLEYAPGGQDKVKSGRMTVHQKFVLSLVDGQRPIREICVASTMLDYELYRFLYLMTKAGILRQRNQQDAQEQAQAWTGRER